MGATSPTPNPRRMGELPSLHLTRDEANALIRVLDSVAGGLSFHERDGATSPYDRVEQLLEISHELRQRTDQGHREAVRALPLEQAERLFEVTYGESWRTSLARSEREHREGGHER